MRPTGFIATALFAGLTAANASFAEGTDIGETLFMEYCSACHGATGKGDGDMASVVNIPAPNLTMLAELNDGVFPMLDVLQTIDGRATLQSHGGVMPVWGRVFSDDVGDAAGPYGSVLEVRGRILSLAQYIESLQQ